MIHGTLRALLRLVIKDSPWTLEFVDELDREYRKRNHSALWYLRQVLSPSTLRFVWMTRGTREGGSGMGVRRKGRGVGREGTAPVEGWWLDVRQAVRAIGREPKSALFVTAILALGIGANGAIFGVADRLLLSGPPHIERPGELARFYLRFEESDVPGRISPWMPYLTARAIQEEANGAQFTLFRTTEELVEIDGRVGPMTVGVADAEFFHLLGVDPLAGRLPSGAGDDQALALVSVGSELGYPGTGDPIGSTLRAAGKSYSVGGVLPADFTGPGLPKVDAWIPLDPDEAGSTNWRVVGRLPTRGPAARVAAAEEATAIHQRTDPGRFFQWALEGRIISAEVSADDGAEEATEASIARLLLVMSGLLFVVAAANVAHLLLARIRSRRRELAVRLALGVGRWRLARLVAAEGFVVGGLAALVSLPLVALSGSLLRSLLLPDTPWSTSPLEPRVIGFVVATGFIAGGLMSLGPVWSAGKLNVARDLKEGSRAPGRRRRTARSGLAVAQLGLSLVLLVGAGLFIRSFFALRSTDLGFDASSTVALSLHSMEEASRPMESTNPLILRAVQAAEQDPGIEAAAGVHGLPFVSGFGLSVHVPGRDSIPELPGGGPWYSAVTEGYFEAVGAEVRRGRAFTPQEVALVEPVVIVSETMARTLWGDSDPLGECMHVGSAEAPCSEVVGVVRDVHRAGFREPESMQYYVPFGHEAGFSGASLVVRVRPGSRGAIDRLRGTLVGLDPAVDYIEARSVLSFLEPELRPWRLGASVLSVTGFLALCVSLLGAYAVLSYFVAERRRELGIRVALGASSSAVHHLVVGLGLRSALLGVACGLVLLVIGGRWIEPLLVETRATDPVVLGGVIVLILFACLFASVPPARRASRIDPVRYLNTD